ncbi:SusC/RagA family TonB-linked outer membrane protein [Pedobacter sp. JY14-1]|uniref:SusC/RagA family TonB-linked outer membrane protein n=1 Tax=Pedobacter sp. JY14-1 TaxID=3034151 RepID=UPI0023E0EF15|nr:SusC/RagA family TonB-linked outer membrane protein [Pedobacter sp. JY14-1]
MSYFRGAITLVLFMLWAANAQAQKMNYTGRQISLHQLFKELKRQTGYGVVWNEQKIDADQKVTANFHNASPDEVMRYALSGTPYTYTIVGSVIVVQRSQQQTGTKSITEPQSEKILELNEVKIVNTGYQRIPVMRATGSFTLVDSAQYNRRVSSDAFSRLEGITSGLLFNKNTLATTLGGLDLSIRGRSTIFANDQPLIILDNFPFYGDFGSLNPNDIAGITVLKDAASAAIWGVRAGNGVIVIDTKRGKTGQELKVSLNTNLTVSKKPDLFYNPNYLSSTDYIYLEQFLFENGRYDQALNDKVSYPVLSPVVQLLAKQKAGLLTPAQTEAQLDVWRGRDIRNEELRYFYRSPVSQQYALSLSGGTAHSAHYFSAGFDRELHELKYNDDNRITINSHNTFNPLKNLEIEAGIYYVRSKSMVDSSLVEDIERGLYPYYQFKDENGNAAEFEREVSSAYKAKTAEMGYLDWTYKPLAEFGRSPNVKTGNNLRFNAGIKYTMLPGLNASLKYQNQVIDLNMGRYNDPGSYRARNLINRYATLTNGKVSSYPLPLGGVLSEINTKINGENFRGQLNYQFESGAHAISAIAGYELSELKANALRATSYGYANKKAMPLPVDTVTMFNLSPSGRGTITTGSKMYDKLERIVSSYANLAYTLKSRYVLSGSARMDGSNYFGVKANHKRVPLWSTGLMWHLDREEILKSDWLPVLKFRASYGYSGNLDRSITGVTTFKHLGSIPSSNLPFADIVNVGNPELGWERIGIANLGLEFGFKEGVINGKLEYYIKNGRDILGDREFPSSTGILALRGNYAKMSGRGYDLTINSKNLRGNFSWSTSLLVSGVSDKVVDYGVVDAAYGNYVGAYNASPLIGRPVFGVYSYPWAGLDANTGDPMGYVNGEVSTDYEAIFKSMSVKDLKYEGPARPTVFGSIFNAFSYRDFSVAFNVVYKLGYYFRKLSVDYNALYTYNLNSEINKDFTARWQKHGDEKITNVPSMPSYGPGTLRDLLYNHSSATVAKGDHIRLQDISLSYDFNCSSWKSVPFKRLQVYLYANNVGILWKANKFGLDPDLIPSRGDLLSSPTALSISFGAKMLF